MMNCLVDDFQEQVNQLVAKHPALRMSMWGDARCIHGTVGFYRVYEDKEMDGEYEIEIHVPAQYPKILPKVFETDGKIDKSYHQHGTGGLCLGTPTEMEMKFKKFPSLLGFVDGLVVPYLFSHAYFIEHGEMPYGERPHNTEGLLHYYNEYFGTSDFVTLKMLKMLTSEKIGGYRSCPCGSNKTISECHADAFDALRNIHGPKYFLGELEKIITLFPPQETDNFRCFILAKKRKGT